MDLEEVRQKLAERMGEQRANHIAVMIMPMIISDFKEMLVKAKPNTPVKEEYYLDDNTCVIELSGYGVGEGADPITRFARVCVDHIEIWRNEQLLKK